MKNFKLHIYKKNGDLDHVEFFETIKEIRTRYDELFIYEKYALNPTAWARIGNKWIKMKER